MIKNNEKTQREWKKLKSKSWLFGGIEPSTSRVRIRYSTVWASALQVHSGWIWVFPWLIGSRLSLEKVLFLLSFFSFFFLQSSIKIETSVTFSFFILFEWRFHHSSWFFIYFLDHQVRSSILIYLLPTRLWNLRFRFCPFFDFYPLPALRF